jgi:hypothetical protein
VAIEASVGGTVSPSQSGYFASGSTVPLVATPAAGYSFVGWVGTGTGSYSGTSPYGNVTGVVGPVQETASFALTPPSSTSASFLASTTGIVVLAIVGLIVGLAVGVVVFRRGKPKAGSPDDGDSGGSA